MRRSFLIGVAIYFVALLNLFAEPQVGDTAEQVEQAMGAPVSRGKVGDQVSTGACRETVTGRTTHDYAILRPVHKIITSGGAGNDGYIGTTIDRSPPGCCSTSRR